MVRRLRSWSGVALFAYLATHFGNHALVLISLDAMEAGPERGCREALRIRTIDKSSNLPPLANPPAGT